MHVCMSRDLAVLSWPGSSDMRHLFIPTTLLQEALEHSITGKEKGLQDLTSQLTKLEDTRADEQVTLLLLLLYQHPHHECAHGHSNRLLLAFIAWPVL